MRKKFVKISVYVPVAATRRAADGVMFDDPPTRIREVIGNLARLGVAVMGNYDSVTMTLRGTGRFRAVPGSDALPSTGCVGVQEAVEEDIVTFAAPLDQLDLIISEIARNHPFETPAIEVLPIIRHRFDGLGD